MSDGSSGKSSWVSATVDEAVDFVCDRLPEESQLDAAVWYISNLWTYEPGAPERTTMPCLLEEFEGGSLLVWLGGDGESVVSFFGTVGPYDF